MADWTKLDEHLGQSKDNDAFAKLDAQLGPVPASSVEASPTPSSPDNSPQQPSGSFGGKIANALGHLVMSGPTFVNYLTGGMTGPLDEPDEKITNKLIQKGIVSPEDVNPSTLGGKVTKGITDTTIGGAPLTLMSGGFGSIPGALKNLFGLVTSGAGGAIGGDLGSHFGPGGEIAGNLIGSSLGAITPQVAEGVTNKLSGLPFNSAISPEVAKLQQTNIGNGITPSINQFFPGIKRPQVQAQQINAVAGTKMGADTNILSHDVYKNIDDTLGQGFNDSAQRIGTINLDNDYLNKLSDITTRTKNAGISDADEATIKKVTDQLDPTNPKNTNMTNNTINGQTYQELTQKNGPISDLMSNTNGTVSNIGTELRGMIDGAMQRSAPPGEAQNVTDLRQKYKNFLMFKDATDTFGNLDPSKLTDAKVSKYYPTFTKGGAGDVGDTIQALQSLKTPYDTPPGKILGIPTATAVGAPLLGAAGYSLAEHLGPQLMLEHPLASLGAGTGLTSLLAAQRGAKAVTNSNWYKNQLIDQALGNRPKYNPLIPFTFAQGDNSQ